MSPDHAIVIQVSPFSSAVDVALVVVLRGRAVVFCCWSFGGRRCQSSGVEVAGSIPSASSPRLPSSCVSPNMPILPAYFGSNRSSMLVIAVR